MGQFNIKNMDLYCGVFHALMYFILDLSEMVCTSVI